MKLLIVDDNRDLRELAKTMLELNSYIVICAQDGTEAFEKVTLEKPALILMDVMMPGVDGFELTRQLRTKPETKDVPILAMTGLCRKSDIDTCVQAGCTDYIIKPFSFSDLVEKINTLLAEVTSLPTPIDPLTHPLKCINQLR